MTTIEQYDGMKFVSLNDFDISKASLSDLDKDIIAIGKIIVKYHLEDTVGVNLLHKHFNIATDEFLIKTRFEAENVSRIGVKHASFVRHATPYLWRISKKSDNHYGLFPLEFIEQSADDVLKKSKKFLKNLKFIEDVSSYIIKNDLCDKLGIVILHASLILSENQVMVEETDSQNKILTLSAAEEAIADRDDVTETTWSFEYLSEADKDVSYKIIDKKTIEIKKNGTTKRITVPSGRMSQILEEGNGTVAGLCIGCCKAHCIKHEQPAA